VAPDQSDLPQLSCAVGSEELAYDFISENRMDSAARTKVPQPILEWNEFGPKLELGGARQEGIGFTTKLAVKPELAVLMSYRHKDLAT
jgi:hypothetical protein